MSPSSDGRYGRPVHISVVLADLIAGIEARAKRCALSWPAPTGASSQLPPGPEDAPRAWPHPVAAGQSVAIPGQDAGTR